MPEDRAECVVNHGELTGGMDVTVTLDAKSESLDSELSLLWPDGRRVKLRIRDLGLLVKFMDSLSESPE